jgi:hypothetical protein
VAGSPAGAIAWPEIRRYWNQTGSKGSGSSYEVPSRQRTPEGILIQRRQVFVETLRDDASLFKSISNLTFQDERVACFENAARHLRPGGRFVIETNVTCLRQVPPGSPTVPFA